MLPAARERGMCAQDEVMLKLIEQMLTTVSFEERNCLVMETRRAVIGHSSTSDALKHRLVFSFF